MKPEVAEALEASIKHWEENAAATEPLDVSTDASSCALCRMFAEGRINYCIGCPVFATTRKLSCSWTPYGDVLRALSDWKEDRTEEKQLAFKAAAQAEVDFLKSLREPKS